MPSAASGIRPRWRSGCCSCCQISSSYFGRYAPALTARAATRAHRKVTEEEEMDAAYLALTLAFFAASWGFIKLCERI
jgi:hypothetical protein